jgi:antitoxin VapB
MAQQAKTRVFMSGRSQHVTIPAQFRFSGNEVYIRRDQQSGDVILSQTSGNWDTIFAALDEAGFSEDFLAEREQGVAESRELL